MLVPETAMHRSAWFGPLLLLTVSWPAHADVYRCDDHGRVTYADRPCSTGQAVPVVLPPEPVGVSIASRARGEGAAPILTGMSPRSVYELMGRPTRMVVRLEGIAPAEHWLYRTGDGTLAVTFRYGRVAQVAMR